MTKVKICGITRLEDARAALDYGADALGFIFASCSPRRIPVQKAAGIVESVSPFCVSVGVFMDQPEKEVRAIAQRLRLSAVQLHGDETRAVCRRLRRDYHVIKTVFPEQQDIEKVRGEYQDSVDAFLLDVGFRLKIKGHHSFSWKETRQRYERFFSSGVKVILSGGLTPDTVQRAIGIFSPYAVDVASGVEYTKGLKDTRLLKSFIQKAKKH